MITHHAHAKGEIDLVMPLVYSSGIALTSLQFPMDLRWCCICYPKAV
jgi:hypothetical protein